MPGLVVLFVVLPLKVPEVPAVPEGDGVVVVVVVVLLVLVSVAVSSRLWQAVSDAAAITAMVPNWAILSRFMRNFLVEKPGWWADRRFNGREHASSAPAASAGALTRQAACLPWVRGLLSARVQCVTTCLGTGSACSEVGAFGTLLYTGHDWVDPVLARRSMELMANEVWPRVAAAQ